MFNDVFNDNDVYTIEDVAGSNKFVVNEVHDAWVNYDASATFTGRAVKTMLTVASSSTSRDDDIVDSDLMMCFYAFALCGDSAENTTVYRTVTTALNFEVPVDFALTFIILGYTCDDTEQLIHQTALYFTCKVQDVLYRCNSMTATIMEIGTHQEAVSVLKNVAQFLYPDIMVFCDNGPNNTFFATGDMVETLVDHVAEEDAAQLSRIMEFFNTMPTSQVVLLGITLEYRFHESFSHGVDVSKGHRIAEDVIKKNKAKFVAQWAQWACEHMEHIGDDKNSPSRTLWIKTVKEHINNAVNPRCTVDDNTTAHEEMGRVNFVMQYLSVVPEKYCAAFVDNAQHIVNTIVNNTWDNYSDDMTMLFTTSNTTMGFPVMFMDMLCSRCNGDVDTFIHMVEILVMSNTLTFYEYHKVSALYENFDELVQLPAQWAAQLLGK